MTSAPDGLDARIRRLRGSIARLGPPPHHHALVLTEDVTAVLDELDRVRRPLAALVEELESEWRRLLDEADAADDEGAHVGFALRYRNVASGISFSLERLRPLAEEALAGDGDEA